MSHKKVIYGVLLGPKIPTQVVKYHPPGHLKKQLEQSDPKSPNPAPKNNEKGCLANTKA